MNVVCCSGGALLLHDCMQTGLAGGHHLLDGPRNRVVGRVERAAEASILLCCCHVECRNSRCCKHVCVLVVTMSPSI
jgi:hypothetical protein